MRFYLLMTAFITLTGLPGCGGEDGPTTYPVSGTVTYQGKPLTKGQIAFRPDTERGGSGPMQAGNIVDGKFTCEATEGPKRIEIYGSWKIPGEFVTAPDGSGKKFPKMASLPGKFNEMSKLTTTIKPTENTGVDFALE